MPKKKKSRRTSAAPAKVVPRTGDATGRGGPDGQVATEPASQLPRILGSDRPFGPSFFRTRLAAFVRDRCPDPAEGLPAVDIHLGDGSILGVCHVISLAESWVVLAIDDRAVAGVPSMRTEIVPFGQIVRVTIRLFACNGERVGFTPSVPTVV